MNYINEYYADVYCFLLIFCLRAFRGFVIRDSVLIIGTLWSSVRDFDSIFLETMEKYRYLQTVDPSITSLISNILVGCDFYIKMVS